MSEEEQDGASEEITSLAPEVDSDASTNVSQTHIGQMTGSSVQAAEGAKWSCEVCTYENFPLSRKCTMCRSAKPSLGEDIFKLQDGARALPSPDICGAEAVAERLKPLRISSPQGASASSTNKWACPTCTYENWPKATKCAMCNCNSPNAPAATAVPATGGPKSLAAPATGGPKPARPSIGINDIHDLESSGRRCKRRVASTDWTWLQACLGVVEGEAGRVEAYLAQGGDPARALTAAEVQLLDRASAFDAGHTLVHLAIRFQREDILATLLARISGGGPGLKRSPSYIAPDLANAIRRHIAAAVRHRKAGFACRYLAEFCTFTLPAEIDELPGAVQEQLFAELLDRDAQQTLERAPASINWSAEVTVRLGSRLYALWNRSAGDCLPDAACQAAYGVFDRHNALRAALAESLQHAQRAFYERWSAWERLQAALLHYAPDETQLRAEWTRLVAAAARPGTPLHQLHVFALAHVLRRPILVYGVDLVTSFRGEALGYAGFHGAYLPLLWEPDFCSPSPLCLGYTRGHFSALVAVEPRRSDATHLPLVDADGKLLPVPFLTRDELADSEAVLRRWTRARVSNGVLLARQPRQTRPLLHAQMLDEWLNHYRRLANDARGPHPPPHND